MVKEPSITLRKKGYQNSTPGVLLLKIVPFFKRGTLFFLNNHVYPKKSATKQKGTYFQKSASRGIVLQKKVRNGALFYKKGTILVPFFRKGTVSEQQKVKNSTPLTTGTIKYP